MDFKNFMYLILLSVSNINYYHNYVCKIRCWPVLSLLHHASCIRPKRLFISTMKSNRGKKQIIRKRESVPRLFLSGRLIKLLVSFLHCSPIFPLHSPLSIAMNVCIYFATIVFFFGRFWTSRIPCIKSCYTYKDIKYQLLIWFNCDN